MGKKSVPLIDKGAGVPARRRGRKPVYKFATMLKGDAYFVADAPGVQQSIITASKRHAPMEFTTRAVVRGGKRYIGYWRIK
jgi:hypothetical protein